MREEDMSNAAGVFEPVYELRCEARRIDQEIAARPLYEVRMRSKGQARVEPASPHAFGYLLRKDCRCGRGCFVSLRTDAVGHTSTARQAASRSSGDTGCRAKMLLPSRATMRPGATWRDAPQSIHAVSMYQSPVAESGLRTGFIAYSCRGSGDGSSVARLNGNAGAHLIRVES